MSFIKVRRVWEEVEVEVEEVGIRQVERRKGRRVGMRGVVGVLLVVVLVVILLLEGRPGALSNAVLLSFILKPLNCIYFENNVTIFNNKLYIIILL